jgi:hypothetical protein
MLKFEYKSIKSKRAVAFLLFVLYLGGIALIGQNTPLTYIANKTSETITIDGEMDEESWKKAIWSTNFIDIEGTKEPTYKTNVKMIWDESYLYFFSEIKEPHFCANLKQKYTIIFYNNDFEIFIDPDGDTHNYYELELNAFNTVWDLFLSKPYRNNGYILDGWDFKGIKTAIHINGTLNDPSDIDEGWSVEIAIPWSFTTEPGGKTKVPENDFWRINFSRVNWSFSLENGKYSRKKDATGKFLHENNWVWSPQGVINMHEPEHWGYVYFANDTDLKQEVFTIPNDEHIKWYLYKLYRDLKNDKIGDTYWTNTNGQWQMKPKLIRNKEVTAVLEKNNFGFNIWVKSPFTNKKLVVHNDGKFETYDDDKK